MKSGTHYRTLYISLAIALLVLFVLSQTAWAAEGGPGWRGNYDIGMKWLNFFILAFIIVKFAKAPLKNFLAGQKEKVETEIQVLEKEKSKVQSQVADAQAALTESDARFADLKEKIIRQAEKEKAQIIESAKEQSRLMLESAQQRVENRIQHAKAAVMAELVDNAVAGAMKKLPTVITPEDDQKYLELFMSKVQSL